MDGQMDLAGAGASQHSSVRAHDPSVRLCPWDEGFVPLCWGLGGAGGPGDIPLGTSGCCACPRQERTWC